MIDELNQQLLTRLFAAEAQLAATEGRLSEVTETLSAIRDGAIDGLVVNTPEGDRIFTLEGSEHPYRVMIEAMEEGAATLSADGTLLYCNRRFAALLRAPSAQVLGARFSGFLAPESYARFLALNMACRQCNVRDEVVFQASDGTQVPVSLACSLLPEGETDNLCLVATDLTAYKAAEATIRQQNAALEANRALLQGIAEQKMAEALIKQQHEELRGLAQQLAQTAEIERLRLARDLHDGVGQQLTVLSLHLQLLAEQMPADISPRVRGELDRALLLLETIGKSVRDMLVELRPPVLDDYGLGAALRAHGEQLARLSGLAIEVRENSADFRVSPEREIAFFRIAQEALINVVRHARARHVTITFTVDEVAIILTISDDGIGFTPRAATEGCTAPGWGLLGMRERKSTADVAEVLSLSPNTVDTYRSRLMQKLGYTDLPNLVKFAIRHGLTMS